MTRLLILIVILREDNVAHDSVSYICLWQPDYIYFSAVIQPFVFVWVFVVVVTERSLAYFP